ncbi:MAG TPA: carboxypeptidase regulatory-like domain-containing protein [Candidatus Saccharimonadales bacterium]|nr:carboxypeptidase regulatory-like domain-containing protein [Candidatus Saccharimonadales bacterium]
MKKLLNLLLVVTMVAISAPIGFAQATATGTIAGTASDKAGAVIVGAAVVATNRGTGSTRTTTTNSSGDFRFDQLSAGSYVVKISKAGFATYAQSLELLIGQTATVAANLKPGQANEVIEVTGDIQLIDQAKTSVSQQITPSEVEELPLLGRDVANLAYLAPGVKSADSFDPTKNRSAVLSVNGNVGREVNVTVNGVDNKDSTVGGTVMQLPLEAVEEFVISTQRFSAANGRSEGAAINMITKSGSNSFHGSAFGYFRDEKFNADRKLADGTTSNGPYSRQQFGGSIGGPIVKNKAFAFFALERQREHTSIPESGNAFTELKIATTQLGMAAQPASNIPTPFFENRLNGRLDYKFSDKETAYISYTSQANNSLNDQSDGNGDLTGGNLTTNHMQIANFTLNSVLSNSLVNSFTFGNQYWNNIIDVTTKNAPYITFASGEWFGTNVNVPQQSFQRKWQWRDDITKTIGNHTLKAGFDYIWNPSLGGYFSSNSTLEIDFLKDPSDIANLAGGFANPGLVGGMSISNGDSSTNVPGGTKQFGIYFQDDWKTTKRLTLNLGLRWDKDINLIGGSAIGISKTFLELKAIGSPYAVKPHDDNKDFSPRVGFAYDLTGAGKHVLRGGFGLYYGNVYQNIPLWMEQMANPTVYQQALSLGIGDTVPGFGIPLSQWTYSPANVATVLANVPGASSQLSPQSTGRTMDPKYRNPYTEEFNFGYQWAINQKAVFEAEYVHTLGLHSNVDVNINPTDPDTGVRPLAAAFNAAGVPALGRIMDNQSIGRSRYDGLNLSYRQHMVKNFNLVANYTLSRAVGYSTASGGPPTLSSSQSSYHSYPHDPLRPLASWDFGPTPFDERHHITISGIANLPFGLEAAPILQFGSARPYDLNAGYDILGLGTGYSRPVVVDNSAPKNYYMYDNSGVGHDGAAARAALAAGTAHILHYDSLRGAPIFELDARVSKNIKLGEQRRLQLSFQGFNLTNRANYGNNYFYAVTSGKIGTPSGFTNPTSSSSAFAFVGEFGARFTF